MQLIFDDYRGHGGAATSLYTRQWLDAKHTLSDAGFIRFFKPVCKINPDGPYMMMLSPPDWGSDETLTSVETLEEYPNSYFCLCDDDDDDCDDGGSDEGLVGLPPGSGDDEDSPAVGSESDEESDFVTEQVNDCDDYFDEETATSEIMKMLEKVTINTEDGPKDIYLDNPLSSHLTIKAWATRLNL